MKTCNDLISLSNPIAFKTNAGIMKRNTKVSLLKFKKLAVDEIYYFKKN